MIQKTIDSYAYKFENLPASGWLISQNFTPLPSPLPGGPARLPGQGPGERDGVRGNFKYIWLVLTSLLVSLFLIISSSAQPQSEIEEDKTLSPYFFVKSDDSELDQLPLKSTTATVTISGVIADVVVNQIYKNEGKKPLEAIYIFPSSTKAAVYGMKMTIGERTITAKIEAREKARQDYEQARQEGKSASLLEQQRPNVFQMNVANILPGDTIKVELSYTELLVPTDSIYEFVYPTVVGPRYSNQDAETAPENDKWVANPYLPEGAKAPTSFDITTSISTGIPIQEITCPSHKVNISYDGPATAVIKLDESKKSGGNRDYILKYRLAGDKIESGLMLYQGGDEKFFLMMIQPPKRVKAEQIPPRDYIFIVDVSGSMHGFPLEVSKELLHNLISNLRTTDTFNVLLFSGNSTVMSEQSIPANKENIQKAIDIINQQQGGGGTELLPALKRALSLPKTEGSSQTIVIATDGYVNVEAEVFDLIRNNLNKANVFAFGIGSSVNRFIIEGMAHAGAGEPFVITKPESARGEAEKFRKYIESPVMTQIKVDFNKFDVYDVEPITIPDLLAERPIIVFGKWRGEACGQIHWRGIAGKNAFTEKIDVAQKNSQETNSSLRYLWARHRIAILSDYNKLSKDDEKVKEVTNLGLSYNLLTDYTSFVAIDNQVRLKDGKATTIKQPLPLPQGVSSYAVGHGFLKAMLAPLSAAPRSEMSFQNWSSRNNPLIMGSASSDEKRDRDNSDSKNSSIKVKKIVVKGNISKKDIQELIEKHLGSIESCLKKTSAMLAQSNEAVLIFNIDSNGRVTEVHLDKPKDPNKSFEQCIIESFSKVQFPLPEDKKNAKIIVTLGLR